MTKTNKLEIKDTFTTTSTSFILPTDDNENKKLFKEPSIDYKQELIRESINHKIPYNPVNPDWDKIEDNLSIWEHLIQQADDFNIEYNHLGYDPIALEQLIEDVEEANHKEMMEHRLEYNQSRGVL